MRITWKLHENYMRLHEDYMRVTGELQQNFEFVAELNLWL